MDDNINMANNQTITITLCDCAENHVGMEKIGTDTKTGFQLKDLFIVRDLFINMGAQCKIFDLNYPIENIDIYPNDEAYILIIKNGIDFMIDKNDKHDKSDKNDVADDLFDELANLKWDTKAFMYGRVVNKHARHNLCFADYNRKPDYQNGKGRIIAFENLPLLAGIRNKLGKILNCKLVAEGNYYYDVDKCGISYHGDSERSQVIGLRLGATMPLVFQWFHDANPVSENIMFNIEHGDIYIMSEKATGNDWKRRSIYTLRHAAGAAKYLTIKNLTTKNLTTKKK